MLGLPLAVSMTDCPSSLSFMTHVSRTSACVGQLEALPQRIRHSTIGWRSVRLLAKPRNAEHARSFSAQGSIVMLTNVTSQQSKLVTAASLSKHVLKRGGRKPFVAHAFLRGTPIASHEALQPLYHMCMSASGSATLGAQPGLTEGGAPKSAHSLRKPLPTSYAKRDPPQNRSLVDVSQGGEATIGCAGPSGLLDDGAHSAGSVARQGSGVQPVHMPSARNLLPWHPSCMLWGEIAMAGSCLDFNLAPSGAGTWRYLSSGQQVWYLVPPTPKNMQLFAEQINAPRHAREAPFEKQASQCFVVTLSEGQLLVVPPGYIMAFRTLTSSVGLVGHFFSFSSSRDTLAARRTMSCFPKPLLKPMEFPLQSIFLRALLVSTVHVSKAECESEASTGTYPCAQTGREKNLLKELDGMTVALKFLCQCSATSLPDALLANLHALGQELEAATTQLEASGLADGDQALEVQQDHIRGPLVLGSGETRPCLSQLPTAHSIRSCAGGKPQLPHSTGFLYTRLCSLVHEAAQHLVLSEAVGIRGQECAAPSLRACLKRSRTASRGSKAEASRGVPKPREAKAPRHDSTDVGSPVPALHRAVARWPSQAAAPPQPAPQQAWSGEHRRACHMCGNMRKHKVLCTACPQVFCRKCAVKCYQQWGKAAFEGRCPHCAEWCCCVAKQGKQPRCPWAPQSVLSTGTQHEGKSACTGRCMLTFHCYKKCPTVKAGKAAASRAARLPMTVEEATRSMEARIRRQQDLLSVSPPSLELDRLSHSGGISHSKGLPASSTASAAEVVEPAHQANQPSLPDLLPSFPEQSGPDVVASRMSGVQSIPGSPSFLDLPFQEAHQADSPLKCWLSPDA